ncbi:E3 ubiquitin-protein ligase Topors-like [Lytechinus pictus]|uniref:E3 ubiquitin-protein ligase Topors-like n=1 Tax=Lytechinus pictus TaxID=7653 RepID=UPI0030B9CD0D
MDGTNVQRGLQKALNESSSKGISNEAELAPTDSDASSRSGSPDQCCSICLGKFKDKSFSDGCFHRFCFQCIREWAKVKSTCPLCKTPFKSIIHNVVSSDVYDQYMLPPTENGSLELDHNGARFRYHTTLANNRRSAWETRMDQLFSRQARLAERIHRENEARQRRQLIYAAGLRVHHIAANRFTRFRDTSPQFFRESQAVTHRLIPWLRRDLGVLFNGNDQHVRFMTQYILSLLPNVDIQSEEFHNHLRPFLYGRTEHFIHEFTSFARSPHDMDTYDQMAQYDFRPENPQFTATLRPQHPLVAQENSSSEESENNHSNNEVIVISDDDDTESNLFVLPGGSSQSASLGHHLPGPSSSTSVTGPSASYNLADTHNPEPPASRDLDQPGPSGVTLSGSLQIKQEHDSASGRKKSDDGEDSSGSVEIVGYQKPFHLRTPIAFITISDDLSDDQQEKGTKGKLSRNKEKSAPKRNHIEEKAGGKRKQKTKHTRSLHASSRASTWSTDSDESYYNKSRHDGYYKRRRDTVDDRDGPSTSHYDSRYKSSSKRQRSRSPNELFRKAREEESKWSLYYETRHDDLSNSRYRRSRSRSRSTHSKRYGEDSRSLDNSRTHPRPLRDERRWRRSRSRSRSRSREWSRNRSRYYRDEDYRRSRSRSRGRSMDFFSDDSKFSSRYGSRYGSTSSTFSRLSHQDSHAPHSSKKDNSSATHVGTSKASRSPVLKHRLDDDHSSKEGDSHVSKRHKHKQKHHKKKSSKHKHKRSRDKDSKSRKKDKRSRHHSSSSHVRKSQDEKEKAIVESISDSTVEDKDKANGRTSQSKIRTMHSNHGENQNITLQDLLNMDESMIFDPSPAAGNSDKGNGSML